MIVSHFRTGSVCKGKQDVTSGALLNRGVKCAKFLILTLALLVGRAINAGEAEPLDIVRSELVATQALFAKLTAYEAQGTILITRDEEPLKRWVDASKVEQMKTQHLSFHVWAKGDALKVQLDTLNPDKSIRGSTISFLDSKKLVYVVSGARSRGSILTRGATVGNDNIYDDCPAFLEYAFLCPSISSLPGLPALVPANLGGKSRWMDVIGKVSSCARTNDGAVKAWITGKDGGYSSVIYASLPDVPQKLYPKEIEFFNLDKSLNRTIKILKYCETKDFGRIADSVQIDAYGKLPGGNENVHQTTWVINFARITPNGEINDDAVAFDPAGVDELWDEEHHQLINVPK